MAITARAAGTWAVVTADSTVTIPGSPQVGDRMYILAIWKPFGTTSQVTSPAGWTELIEFADGVVANGNGVGSVKAAIYYKDYTAGESTPTIDFSANPDVAAVTMIIFQKGAGETWDDPRNASASMTNWTTTSQTVSASGSQRIDIGDLIIGLIGIRDDSATMTRPTTGVAAGAITFTGNYVEYPATHVSTTTGFDLSGDAGYRITSSAGTAAPTMTGTISAAETGVAVWAVQGVTTPGKGQAQAQIKGLGQGFGQAQASIKAAGRGFGQAQASITRIKHTEYYAELAANAIVDPVVTVPGVDWVAGDRIFVVATGRDEGLDSTPTVTATGLTFSNVAYEETVQAVLWSGLWKSDIATSDGTDVDVVLNVLEGGSGHAGGINVSVIVIHANNPDIDAFNIDDTGAVDTDTPTIDLTTVEAQTKIFAMFNTRVRTFTVDPNDNLIPIRENDQVDAAGNISSMSLYYKEVASASTYNLSGSFTTALDWQAVAFSVFEVSPPKSAHGQAQASIKAVGRGFGQAQADIKQTYTDKSGQSQADIKQIYYVHGQAQARVKNTYFGLGQAQANIKAVGRGFGQAQADIKATSWGLGQAQARIKQTYPLCASYSAITQSYGPVGYWRLGDSSGTVMTATVGHNGSYVDTPTLGVAGLLSNDSNTAVSFDGVNERFDISDNAIFANFEGTGQPWTIESWIDHTPDGTARVIVQQWNAGFTERVIFYSSSGNLVIARQNTGGSDSKTATALTAGRHFVVATYDGADLRLYVDGVVQGSPVASTRTIGTLTGAVQNFAWNGIQDELAIFNRALTQIEITEQYTIGIQSCIGPFGQAQARIKNTYRGFGQAQAYIKAVGRGFGQAATRIRGDGAVVWIQDSFNRTLSSDFGTPDIGPPYSEIHPGTAPDSWGVDGSTAYIIDTTAGTSGLLNAYSPIRSGPETEMRLDAYFNSGGSGDQEIDLYLRANENYTDFIEFIFYIVRSNGDISVEWADTGSGIGNTTVGTVSYDTWYSIKVRIKGQKGYAKIWPRGTTEPVWQLEITSAENLRQNGAALSINTFGGTGEIHVDNYQVTEILDLSPGQAQAQIKAVGRGFGQAQARIKQTYAGSGQAQARIKGDGALVYLKDTFTRTDTVLGTPDIGPSYIDDSENIAINGSKLIMTPPNGGEDWAFAQFESRTNQYSFDYYVEFKINASDASHISFFEVIIGTSNFNAFADLQRDFTQSGPLDYELSLSGVGDSTGTLVLGVTYGLRARFSDGIFAAKLWNISNPEPVTWDLSGAGDPLSLESSGVIGFFEIDSDDTNIVSLEVDNINITEVLSLGSGQAQARIKKTYSAHGQAQALIVGSQYAHGQAQAYIKAIVRGYGQAQAWIEQTYNAHGQSQAEIKQIYRVHGQANAWIEQTYNVHGQAQARIKTTYFGLGQAQARIKQVYYAHGQAQAEIKQTYVQHGQAQARIKQVYWGHGQANAWIEQTYSAHGQAQAWIEQTYSAHGQAQAEIKQTYPSHGQAQGYIKTVDNNAHGQAQARIKQVYYGLGQAQAKINAYNVNAHGQAQANIKFEGNAVHGQAQAKINAFDFNRHGQAQAWIETTYNQHGQAQANIKQVYNVHGQAQGQIKTTYYVHGQAQADIKQTYVVHAQAQAWIENTYNGFGQAQAQIKNTYYGHGQANAKINAFGVNAHGQANAYINVPGTNAYGQAQAKIKAIGVNAYGQAQGQIKTTYRSHGQAQADIKQVYYVVGQANAYIYRIEYGHGQAQAEIKQIYRQHSQAQGWIKTTGNSSGQAQSVIKDTYSAHGQAQAYILLKQYGFGQAQALIKTSQNAHGQSQTSILQTYVVSGNAQAWIETTINSSGQAQALISTASRAFGQAQAQITSGTMAVAQAQTFIHRPEAFGQAQALIVTVHTLEVLETDDDSPLFTDIDDEAESTIDLDEQGLDTILSDDNPIETILD